MRVMVVERIHIIYQPHCNLYQSHYSLQNHLESCRYSLVPLGNMVTDQPLFISDVFYSRHLIQHGHIVWCSPTNLPDLGGQTNQ